MESTRASSGGPAGLNLETSPKEARRSTFSDMQLSLDDESEPQKRIIILTYTGTGSLVEPNSSADGALELAVLETPTSQRRQDVEGTGQPKCRNHKENDDPATEMEKACDMGSPEAQTNATPKRVFLPGGGAEVLRRHLMQIKDAEQERVLHATGLVTPPWECSSTQIELCCPENTEVLDMLSPSTAEDAEGEQPDKASASIVVGRVEQKPYKECTGPGSKMRAWSDEGPQQLADERPKEANASTSSTRPRRQLGQQGRPPAKDARWGQTQPGWEVNGGSNWKEDSWWWRGQGWAKVGSDRWSDGSTKKGAVEWAR